MTALDGAARRRLDGEGAAFRSAADAKSTLRQLAGELTTARPNPIDQLVKRFVSSHDLLHHEGQSYAVPRADALIELDGVPGIAIPFGAELRRVIVRVASVITKGAPITRTTADTVMLHLDERAHRAPERPLGLRFHHAAATRQVCIDLGRPDGHAISIDGTGWKVLDRAPAGVLFRRSHATKPLPDPVRGGNVSELASLLALDVDDESFRGLLGWLVGLPFVASPRPGLLMVGPYGAGKSTRLRLAASIWEPSATSALGSAFGKNFGDDQVRAVHRAVPLWDNLTAVSGAVSDELCCLISGTARETRALYSDNDLNVMPIARPVGLTAVGVPAGLRLDALDRLITIDAPPVLHRTDEADLQARFDEAHPRLLGALCDAVACALALMDSTPAPTEYRMAGHARILKAVDLAAGGGFPTGWPAGLLAAYDALIKRVKTRAAAEDSFGAALLDLLEAGGGAWSGKASELLYAAASHTAWNESHGPGWPTSARRVPEVLNQLREGLAALGIGWTTTTVRGKTRYTFTSLPDEGAPR